MMKSNLIRLTLCSLILAALAGWGFTFQSGSLVLGEYTVNRVVDGDTLGVDGLPKTIRFLNIDTEESEKGPDAEALTQEIIKNFTQIMAQATAKDPYPKTNTPLGWEGTLFAKKCFPVGSVVKIEFDEPGREWDYYGRVLGYVFYKKDGKWINYNVECVRQGMSPYSDKYGPSTRFELAFLEAEREARINQRGIWAPGAMAYPDYDGRLRWWNQRGKAYKNFHAQYKGKPGVVDILNDVNWNKMESLKGTDVTLFGSFSFSGYDGSTAWLQLNHNDKLAMGVYVADSALWAKVSPDLRAADGELVYFKGKLRPAVELGPKNFLYTLSLESTPQYFHDVFVPRKARESGDIPTVNTSRNVKHPEGTIPWEEATKYMGQDVTISGTIILTKDIGSRTFLNFSKNFQNQISLMIPKTAYDKFKELPATLFLNRTVKVKGKVSEFQGKPQIVVEDSSQIEILE